MTPVEVHLLTYNEEEILPYTLRHYKTFASQIYVHDSFSTDGTRAIAARYGAIVRDWDTGGQIDDSAAATLKNTAWQGTPASWVIMADADELIYFPGGTAVTLGIYDAQQVAVVKPVGWEMCSAVFPTTTGQIYEEVKFGARDDKWYAKPILFAPARVEAIAFGMGAHGCRAVLTNGTVWNPSAHTYPSTYLLHCKHLGPVARVAKEYDEDLKRLCARNKKEGWGNQGDGLAHAQMKRDAILSKLQQVIP